MDKVSNSNYNYSTSEASMRSWERSPAVVGHHSAVTKAIDAHRVIAEERSHRKAKGFDSEPESADPIPKGSYLDVEA